MCCSVRYHPKRTRGVGCRHRCVAVRCDVLQYVAMCCSTLQRVAVRCNVLQYVAMCCSTLQRVECCSWCVACSMLQCFVVNCSMLQYIWRIQRHATICRSPFHVAVCCSVCCSIMQCVAVHLMNPKSCYNLQISFSCCSVLQCVAVWCNMLQHVAVYYNVLHCTLRTQRPATICRSLSHVAVCVAVCVVVYCSMLQSGLQYVAMCFTYPKASYNLQIWIPVQKKKNQRVHGFLDRS